jgi:hypothetical protein
MPSKRESISILLDKVVDKTVVELLTTQVSSPVVAFTSKMFSSIVRETLKVPLPRPKIRTLTSPWSSCQGYKQ